MKIAGGEFISRLDPNVQREDYASIIKELGLFTVDMGLCTAHILQFGDLTAKDIQTDHGIVNTRDIMPERLRHRVEMLEGLGAKVPEIMAQLAQLPAEDQARIIGRILGDIAFAKGVTKTIALLKEGNLTAVLQEIGIELNEALEGVKESAAVTAEGVAIEITQVAEQNSLANKVINKMGNIDNGIQDSISDIGNLLTEVKITSNVHNTLKKAVENLLKKKQAVLKQIENAKNKVVNKMRPRARSFGLDSSLEKLEDYWKKTEIEYEKIRQYKDDVAKIAKNINIPEKVIHKIKNHVFYDIHELRDGVKRFAANGNMSAAWERLIDGSFTTNDLLLLQHEYTELSLMNELKLGIDPAHVVASKLYNWDITLLRK